MANSRFLATTAARLAVGMTEVKAPVILVGTSIMGTSEVVVVVGRGDALVKKLGVTGTAAPTPETVMATGGFVVRVDRVVGVTGSGEKVNGAPEVVDIAPGVVVRDSAKGNTCVPVAVELAETTVLEKFPVPWIMDPLDAYPLRFEEMGSLVV